MDYYSKSVEQLVKEFSTNLENGLLTETVIKNHGKFGKNILSTGKKQTFFNKLFSALLEPMMLILLFSFVLAFGINLGKFIKAGQADFSECIGILLAIVISVFITLFMEGSSEKAFNTLNKVYNNVYVTVIRDGVKKSIVKEEICVGDIIPLNSGDKILADGRVIISNELSIDESALTGESYPSHKSKETLREGTPLAERRNCVYSGTFVSSGEGKMLVCAVGDNTEIGKIADELNKKREVQSPLQQKLNKLSKTISLIGIISAVLVFVLSLIRLISLNKVTFNGIQELFVSCIILIVAAVPEGLPTIVAVSLALNMIKLAKENALIKKMIATETAGAVSVILSDKTGTLTENKMKLLSVCTGDYCFPIDGIKNEYVVKNIICNSQAEEIKEKGKTELKGSATEMALIEPLSKKISLSDFRKKYKVVKRIPFSSEIKYMQTDIVDGEREISLIKGAPEKVLNFCKLDETKKSKIKNCIEREQKSGKRVLAFAHRESEDYVFDGYAVLFDSIRKEVYKAVKDCKSAGIKVKVLTGDNFNTAYSVAKELQIANSESEVINASEIEKMTDIELKKALNKISVIARSTPIIKLRVVKVLKNSGEVVAVTGDGINDAPAIKHADIGIAMGKTGSEITKDSADVVLLDDSFASLIKAISFGRNVYRNLQRFILFQLSVNLSALLFITVCAVLGMPTPFNTLQLLWINVIMDGPPALTLGLEKMSDKLMEIEPVKRNKSIVTKKMLFKILFNGIFISLIMFWQYTKNILGVKESEKGGTIFTLFIMFQLFNAFNSRGLGSDSLFLGLKDNKIMVITFALTFMLQIVIVTFFGGAFGIERLSLISFIKTVGLSFSIIVVSEAYKFVYRKIKENNKAIKLKSINKNAYNGIN